MIGTPLRRRPVQQRSAQRVERMLDAAAALLDEVGLDALTTSAIAATAEVSVGSLYQFFPDKDAVVQALARRSFERFGRVLETVRARDWREVVDQVVDGYVAFAASEPGFRVLSFGGPADSRALSPSADNSDVVAEALGRLVGAGPQDRMVLRLAVEIGDAVLALAFRQDPAGDAELVAEAKTAVTAYLEARLSIAQPRSAKASFQTGS